MRDAEPGDLDGIRTLLRDYERALGVDLGFQGFEAELAGLPGDYERARGGALLCVESPRAPHALAGCVALRRLDAATCELKRLYVRPEERGSGLGAELLAAALERARTLGYERVRLDTLPSMAAAQRLYRSAGFVGIDAYRANPVPGATFWELSL